MAARGYSFADSLARNASPVVLCGAIALIVIGTAVANSAALDRTVTEALICIVYVVGLVHLRRKFRRDFVWPYGIHGGGRLRHSMARLLQCDQVTFYAGYAEDFCVRLPFPRRSPRSYQAWLRRFSPPSSG